MLPQPILIKGAGDLATGIAHRLWSAGFKLVMLELSQPLAVRRTVSFATAIFEKEIIVEQVKACYCESVEQIGDCLANRSIAVVIDPDANYVNRLKPAVVIDATMIKSNQKTVITDAELVIGLGPGFNAGKDVHAIVETNRGHNLGRVIYTGRADANTGEPGKIDGYSLERVLRSPCAGLFEPLKKIGELVSKGETVAEVNGIAVVAQISGRIRGLLYPGLTIDEGIKIGDIDPRGVAADYRTISDKARAVGGGVLEAIMHHYFHLAESEK